MAESHSKYYQAMVDEKTFSIAWEFAPGRGAVERDQERLIASAEQAAKGSKVHAITITDNAGGNPATSAEMLAVEVNQLGIEPLVHLTCKDKNRNQIEALLWRLLHWMGSSRTAYCIALL